MATEQWYRKRTIRQQTHGQSLCWAIDRLGFSVTCTLVTLEMLTGIDTKGYTAMDKSQYFPSTRENVLILTLNLK